MTKLFHVALNLIFRESDHEGPRRSRLPPSPLSRQPSRRRHEELTRRRRKFVSILVTLAITALVVVRCKSATSRHPSHPFLLDVSNPIELPEGLLTGEQDEEEQHFGLQPPKLRGKDIELVGTHVPESCFSGGNTFIYHQGEYRANFHQGRVVVNCQTLFYRAITAKIHMAARESENGVYIGIMSNNAKHRQEIRQIFEDKLPAADFYFVVSGQTWDQVMDEYDEYQDLIWFDKHTDNDDIFDTSYKTLGFALVMAQHARDYQTLVTTDDTAFFNLPEEELTRLITGDQDISAQVRYGISATGEVRRALSHTHVLERNVVECASKLIPSPGYALMDSRMSIYKLTETCEIQEVNNRFHSPSDVDI